LCQKLLQFFGCGCIAHDAVLPCSQLTLKKHCTNGELRNQILGAACPEYETAVLEGVKVGEG